VGLKSRLGEFASERGTGAERRAEGWKAAAANQLATALALLPKSVRIVFSFALSLPICLFRRTGRSSGLRHQQLGSFGHSPFLGGAGESFQPGTLPSSRGFGVMSAQQARARVPAKVLLLGPSALYRLGLL